MRALLASVLLMVLGLGPSLASASTLAGRVITDPRARLRVAVNQAGQLEAPPGGFPAPGQALRAGQVLAYLRPSIPAPERRDLDAQLTTASRDVKIGELQVRRFNVPDADKFDGQLAIPSLQILGDYRSARERRTQLETALDGRVALVAERDGTLLLSLARSDRNVAAGETIFELGNTGGLAVEASSPDDALDATRFDQALPLRGSPSRLRLVSESFDPELRARRFLYALDARSTLHVGEPVRLGTALVAP